MLGESLSFEDPTGLKIHVYKWSPEEHMHTQLRGIVQIAHGMVEQAARYRRFAEELTKAGYIVYANDHRGHGKTAGEPESVGMIGEDGFNWMVRNLHQLNGMIREGNGSLPVYLFGHSMGALLAQRYSCVHGDTIQGVILSGSSGKPEPAIHLGILLARLEMRIKGADNRSKLLNAMTFYPYNRAFRPTRTGFDWLSRDPKEVDCYMADPYCGVVPSSEFFYHLYCGLRDNYKAELLKNFPKDLPVRLISGERDPLGANGKGVLQLYHLLRGLGLQDVTYKLYPGSRHEILNETNRDEVMSDVIAWLNAHTNGRVSA